MINVLIETNRVELVGGELTVVEMPLTLPASVPQFTEFYDIKTLWPAASLERRRAALA